MARPETPSESVATEESLIWASCKTLSMRCLWRVRSWTKTVRVRVKSRGCRTGLGGTNDARTMPRSVSLASHTASRLSVFGRPGTFLT